MVESTASSVQYETIQVSPLIGALGTEIQGVDLTRPLTDRAVAEIRHAWLAYQLVVFRDQDITPQQQRDFAERFGELDTIDNHSLTFDGVGALLAERVMCPV